MAKDPKLTNYRELWKKDYQAYPTKEDKKAVLEDLAVEETIIDRFERNLPYLAKSDEEYKDATGLRSREDITKYLVAKKKIVGGETLRINDDPKGWEQLRGMSSIPRYVRVPENPDQCMTPQWMRELMWQGYNPIGRHIVNAPTGKECVYRIGYSNPWVELNYGEYTIVRDKIRIGRRVNAWMRKGVLEEKSEMR